MTDDTIIRQNQTQEEVEEERQQVQAQRVQKQSKFNEDLPESFRFDKERPSEEFAKAIASLDIKNGQTPMNVTNRIADIFASQIFLEHNM